MFHASEEKRSGSLYLSLFGEIFRKIIFPKMMDRKYRLLPLLVAFRGKVYFLSDSSCRLEARWFSVYINMFSEVNLKMSWQFGNNTKSELSLHRIGVGRKYTSHWHLWWKCCLFTYLFLVEYQLKLMQPVRKHLAKL